VVDSNDGSPLELNPRALSDPIETVQQVPAIVTQLAVHAQLQQSGAFLIVQTQYWTYD
jgi:hypothetical protein